MLRQDINYRGPKKKKLKNTNTGRLNNACLNNEQVTEEIKRGKKFLKTNDKENIATQSLWDAAKTVLRRKLQFSLVQLLSRV